MKIAIYYFSGCGNTELMALKAQKKMQSIGHDVLLFQNIERPLPEERPQTDVDFFMMPVYFFGLPANVVRYITHMPVVAGRKAVFIAVDGGFSGTARRYASFLLKGRGYEVISTSQIVMPDTFLPLKKSQMDEKERKELLNQADEQLQKTLDVLNHLPPLKKENIFLFIIAAIVYFPLLYWIRHTMGFCFVSKSTCIHCGRCAQNCPKGVIQMKEGRPHWSVGCVGCFRCVQFCPVAAIDLSWYGLGMAVLGGLLGWTFFGAFFVYLGPFMVGMMKWVGLFLGFYGGAFIYQKISLRLPTDKALVMSHRKRIVLSDEEKRLS